MRYAVLATMATLTLLPPTAVRADPINGQQPAICAALDARSCTDDAGCQSGQPAALDAPRFLRVDFTGKSIRSNHPDGGPRTTSIESLRTVEDRMILSGVEQGAEGPVGWNLVIGQEDGDMTLAVAGKGVALILFGACTPSDMPPTATGSSSPPATRP